MVDILRLKEAQVAALTIDDSKITPADQQWVTDDHRDLLQMARDALISEMRLSERPLMHGKATGGKKKIESANDPPHKLPRHYHKCNHTHSQ
jgi:hypothetical protein